MATCIATASCLAGCKNDDSGSEIYEDDRCITVLVKGEDDGRVFGEVLFVDDSVSTSIPLPHTPVSFAGKDIGFMPDSGDVVSIRLLKYEVYQGHWFGYASRPIVAKKVTLCNTYQ